MEYCGFVEREHRFRTNMGGSRWAKWPETSKIRASSIFRTGLSLFEGPSSQTPPPDVRCGIGIVTERAIEPFFMPGMGCQLPPIR